MKNRTSTQNGTSNNDKQANKITKLYREWAQGATITPLQNSSQQKNKQKKPKQKIYI